MKVTQVTRTAAKSHKYANICSELRRSFETQELVTKYTLFYRTMECIPPDLVGTTVDHLTRFLSGTSIDNIWPQLNYYIEMYPDEDQINHLRSHFNQCYHDHAVDHELVKDTLILDAGSDSKNYRWQDYLQINEFAYKNISNMIYRSLDWLDSSCKKIKLSGIHVSDNCKSLNVGGLHGEIDYISDDTLWDMKVSDETVIRDRTILQLLAYWRLLQFDKDVYNHITRLGIYNPRTSRKYTLMINSISDKIVNIVDTDILQLRKE